MSQNTRVCILLNPFLIKFDYEYVDNELVL